MDANNLHLSLPCLEWAANFFLRGDSKTARAYKEGPGPLKSLKMLCDDDPKRGRLDNVLRCIERHKSLDTELSIFKSWVILVQKTGRLALIVVPLVP